MTPTRTAVRVLASAALTAALAGGALASAGPAAADPWLTWSVITDATPGGVISTRPYAGPIGSTTPRPLAAADRALAVDASASGRVVAYVTQIKVAGRDRARRGLTVLVAGRARTVLTGGVSGRPDVSADGRYVTFGRANGSVSRYDVRTRAIIRLCRACTGFPTGGDLAGQVANVALSPDTRHVAVWGWTEGDAEALSVHRTRDGRRVAIDRFGEGEPDITMAWTTDSRQVAYAAIAPYDPSSPRMAWTTALLGIDGKAGTTAIRSSGSARLSGPMRLAGAWWFVRTSGVAPTAKIATVLRTTSLQRQPTVVGTVRVNRISGYPYVGNWSLTSRRPAALP